MVLEPVSTMAWMVERPIWMLWETIFRPASTMKSWDRSSGRPSVMQANEVMSARARIQSWSSLVMVALRTRGMKLYSSMFPSSPASVAPRQAQPTFL